MFNCNFKDKNNADDFLNLLFRYISVFGDNEKIKTKIGLATAMHLHNFLTSFVQRNEESIIAFASLYFNEEDETI